MFGKYQLICILGRGRCGTVYLAMHLELEEYRAVKQVSKNCTDYQKFRKEALLLKRLRHPGIPIVYDLQEDEEFSYLIEEFISGDSFYEIIQKKGHLNRESVIRYGIQICDLVDYLHSAEEVPILYLDLQPRNLMLCHEQVKLLDFEHAGTCTEANQRKERYGTPGFCAPEQRRDGELGVHTDVYQIGAILAYFLNGSEEQETAELLEDDLGKIIRRCLRSDGRDRYPSVAELRQALCAVHTKTGTWDNQSASLILAFAGTRAGIGVTHLALGASAYLNQQGYPCLYEEHNCSGDVRSILQCLGKEADSYGIGRTFGVPMKPWYGKAVRLPQPQYQVVVRDYGCDWKAAGEAARECPYMVLILVAGGKWWHQKSVEAEGRKVVVFNQAIPGAVRQWRFSEPNPEKQVLLRAPYFANPFRMTESAAQFFTVLCRHVAGLAGITPDKIRLKSGKRIGFWDSFVRNREKRNIQRRIRSLS